MQQVEYKLNQKQALLTEMEELLEQRKLMKARSSLKDFCEYVIKDEKTGNKIKIADLQMAWINHIGFCKNHGINALILAPMASGKCVDPETVFLTRNGYVQAADLKPGIEVLGFDRSVDETAWTVVRAVEPQAPMEIFEVKTESGRILRVSHNHQFLVYETKSGLRWVKARDLVLGDKIAGPSNWLVGATGPDYYGQGLVEFSNEPFRVDLPRLLEYVKTFDFDFDRALFEKSGIVKMQELGYNPLTYNRAGVATYLAGVFDGAANYRTSLKMYEIESNSKEKLFTISFLLAGLGIKSKVVRRVKPTRVSYSLLVPKEYTGNVQLAIPCKLTSTRSHLPCKTANVTSFMSDPVTDIRSVGHEITIGVETESHTHVTNGLITHNTQIVGVALPLYLLGKDPTSRIKVVCLSDEAAKDRLTAIQSYIAEDEDYQRVFPHIKKDKTKEWSKHNITSERPNRSAKDPSVSAKGVLANGIGGRCDILLVDDIFDQRTAVAQPATRDQINATYRLVWLSRIDNPGFAVVICTRWHERDLAGEILNDPAMRNQYGILIQSINADFTGIDIKVVIPDHLRDKYIEAVGGFTQV